MEFDKSRIERLKRSLYSRDESLVPQERRTPVRGVEPDVPNNWGAPKNFDFSEEIMAKKNNSFFNKFLGISIVFFVLSLGVALFIFFGGLNMISSNNIDIKITGPSSVSSGEELNASLSIVNGNRTDLENVSLTITYPEGTRAVGQDGGPLTREKINLDTIGKGTQKEYVLRALLFGEKSSVKTFTLSVEYSIKGSNAVFSKEKTYEVSIGSSPLLLNVSVPPDVNSGQEVVLTVEITSNSPVVVQNALVKVDYPYGFTYKDASMKPIRDTNVWNVGDLKNGDKKTLRITGVIVGQDTEERSFTFTVGTPLSSGASAIDTPLASLQSTVAIHKSFFNLSLSPGESGNGVARSNDNAPIRILWNNTLSDKIVNGQISLVLSGNAYDQTSISPGNGGYFRSIDNTVVWDKTSISSLASFSPGEGGDVGITIRPLSESRIIKNPHVDFKAVMTGERLGNNAGTVTSEDTGTLKFSSDITLKAISTRIGTFTNTGPIPPKANTASTYTITWTITNTSNDLKKVTVKATLPTNVSWVGEISPQAERVSYNPDTRQVVWNIDSVTAGAGFTNSPKNVSFKVSLTPSITQVGSAGLLLSGSHVDGVDTYTNATLTQDVDQVTTRFSDASFVSGNETIVQ